MNKKNALEGALTDMNISTVSKKEENCIQKDSIFRKNELFSLEGFEHKALFQDNFLWGPLLKLDAYLANYPFEIQIEIPEGVFLKNRDKIFLGKGTILEPGVYIEGPCIIGKNCTIKHGAYVRPYTVLGDECTIGHSTEIKRTILLNNAVSAHFSYVGDSILGRGINLGAGVKCANLRLDRGEISVFYKGKRFQTHLKKLGAFVGDGSQIGCNSVLNPGTVIAKNTLLAPLCSYKGWIDGSCRVSKTD